MPRRVLTKRKIESRHKKNPQDAKLHRELEKSGDENLFRKILKATLNVDTKKN